MAAYATKKDFTDRGIREQELVEVTDRDIDPQGVIVTRRLDQCVKDASDLIDGYLTAGGYTLPLTAPYPAVITKVCVDVARYALHPRNARSDDGKTEVRVRYEDAIAWLEKVAAGKIAIPGITPGEEAVLGGTAVSKKSIVFGDEFVEDYDVSQPA